MFKNILCCFHREKVEAECADPRSNSINSFYDTILYGLGPLRT